MERALVQAMSSKPFIKVIIFFDLYMKKNVMIIIDRVYYVLILMD